MIDSSFSKQSIKDNVTAILLALVFLLLSFRAAGNNCYWGDDYAAYISEGIAISEGLLSEQAQLNLLMHPSPLPDEADAQELVYVWGYPLLLSCVYNLTGFDRNSFSTIIFYKYPSIIAFSLTAALLFLFLRRTVGYNLSLTAACVFCSCAFFFDFLNTLYSDIVFLFFALFSLYLDGLFLKSDDKSRRILHGIILALSLWFTYEVRLNGIAIVLACAAAHLISCIFEKKRLRELAFELFPFALFFVFKIISEAILAKPTSNLSDAAGATPALFLSNLKTYYIMLSDWTGSLWNGFFLNPLYSLLRRIITLDYSALVPLRSVCVYLSFLLFIVGVLTTKPKSSLHLIILFIGYIIVASMLPYTQGLRYVFPLLPLIVYFAFSGIAFIVSRAKAAGKKLLSGIGTLMTAVICLLCIFSAYTNSSPELMDIEIVNVEDVYMQNAYSDEAINVYRYIIDETGEDCTIAFFAPRGLYLNTKRLSVRPGVNGHSMDEADYYLEYLKTGSYCLFDIPEDSEMIYENSEFKLYKLS